MGIFKFWWGCLSDIPTYLFTRYIYIYNCCHLFAKVFSFSITCRLKLPVVSSVRYAFVCTCISTQPSEFFRWDSCIARLWGRGKVSGGCSLFTVRAPDHKLEWSSSQWQDDNNNTAATKIFHVGNQSFSGCSSQFEWYLHSLERAVLELCLLSQTTLHWLPPWTI